MISVCDILKIQYILLILHNLISQVYNFEFDHPVLQELDFNKKIIFMTAHRRENLGEPLHHICEAVKEIAD